MKESLLSGLNQSLFLLDPFADWSNWNGEPGDDVEDWIDSELLFLYVMSYIMDANGDVVSGLRAALREQDFYGYDVLSEISDPYNGHWNIGSLINFAISDGESIYVFRNSEKSGGPNDDNTHELSLRTYDSGIVGVATRDGNTWNGDDLPQFSLTILPPTGSPIIMHDFLSEPGAVADNKRYHNGSNWVCYPVLPTSGGPAVDDFFTPLAFTNLMGGLQIQHESVSAAWDGDEWFLGVFEPVTSLRGYKVNISDGNFSRYKQPVEGAQRLPENTQLTLHSGVNYVPYFLEDIQHPSEAFPQSVLDVLTSIQGEYWFMIQRDGEFIVKKECGDYIEGGGPTECYTLEYGAMYQVSVSQPVSFRWNQPAVPPFPYEKPFTVYFEPERKPDYIPVVIEEMEDGAEIVEIAAIQDGVCVGAEVVDGFPVNLQVYVDDLSGVSYEAVAAGGTVQLASAGDQAAPATVRRSMVPSGAYRENGAVFMSMRKGEIDPVTAPVDFRIETAYPNPFNPTTTLQIQLARNAELSLVIFNVQGRQVAKLFDGQLLAGAHELSWSGEAVSSGVYYAVLTNGQVQSVQKLLLIK